MNRKTALLAVAFLCLTLVWFGVKLYWMFQGGNSVTDLLIALLLVAAGGIMVWNECHKKKRRRLDEVNPHQIP